MVDIGKHSYLVPKMLVDSLLPAGVLPDSVLKTPEDSPQRVSYLILQTLKDSHQRASYLIPLKTPEVSSAGVILDTNEDPGSFLSGRLT